MQNHADKPRDIARSILPSTRPVEARKRRVAAHRRERAVWRRELAALRTLVDPEDYDGDLCWIARSDLDEMVGDRRRADNVSALLRWARAHVERDPALRELEHLDVLRHFRRVLPDGLVGRHALTHIDSSLDDSWRWWLPSRRREPVDVRPDLHRIVAAGAHGALNRRLRQELTTMQRRVTWREIDGVLRPIRRDRKVPPRLLAGAHDIDSFAADATDAMRRIVLAVAATCP